MLTTSLKLTSRERVILDFLYESRELYCVDFGNILSAYSEKFDDWKDPNNKSCDTAITSLINNSLIYQDEPPLDCFYHISDKGELYIHELQTEAKK